MLFKCNVIKLPSLGLALLHALTEKKGVCLADLKWLHCKARLLFLFVTLKMKKCYYNDISITTL